MLSDWHEFDVGVAHVGNICDELGGEVLVVFAHVPRAQVDLVDAHGGGIMVDASAGAHPLLVAPGVGGFDNNRSGLWRDLGALSQGVGFVDAVALGGLDRKLIDRPGMDLGNKQLPHARGAETAHGVLGGIPPVEITNDSDANGIGCPHCEGCAADFAHRGGVGGGVGSKDIPQAFMAAFTDQMQIHGAKGGQEGVGVCKRRAVLAPVDLKAVVAALVPADVSGEIAFAGVLHGDDGAVE